MAENISIMEAAHRRWDAVVVGAGPAGSMAAHALAKTGQAVLLVDRCVFPRPKTCGCCLSEAALRLLRQAGLRGMIPGSAVALSEFRIQARGRMTSVRLPGGVALSREALDSALVGGAQAAGTAFLPDTEAALEGVSESGRAIRLTHQGREWRTRARVVLAADGLSGRLLNDEPSCSVQEQPGSRIGVSAILPHAPQWCAPGAITMACGAEGYAGFVRLEDGRLNIAAALDPSAVAAHQGTGAAVASLMREAGMPEAEGVARAEWRGVPGLSRRRRRVSAERLFVLGDSAGYVEPFTGEGMAWAMASGLAVAPLALAGIERWDSGLSAQWERRYRRLVGRRQRACRVIAGILRRPVLTRAAIRLVSWSPGMVSACLR